MKTSASAQSKATSQKSTSASTPTSKEVTVPFNQRSQVGDMAARVCEIMEQLCSVAGEEDVTIGWYLEAIRGEDEVVLRLPGFCTFNRLLAPESIHLAKDKFADELIQKIVVPAVSYIQAETNRRALELAGPAPDNSFGSLT